MELKKNDIVTLNIEGCDLGGSGIGRLEGMAVFVPRAAEGDLIDARILKVKKTYAYAKTEKIITPSPYRTESPCPVYGKCGGCVFGHLKYEQELKIKENHVKECFKRIAGCEPEFESIIPGKAEYGYRNKAQYPVRSVNGETVTGFYANHSHRVTECSECLLQPPEFAGIVKAVKAYMAENGISAYDEESGKGLVRHIFIRKAAATGEIMVCPVINGRSLPNESGLCRALLSACPGIKSVMLSINEKDTNVVMGGEYRLLYGDDYITDVLAGLKFRLSAQSFYQVNHDTAEILYAKAAEYAGLTGGETVLDLYCGTGTIGLSMAGKVREIIGVEIVPQAIEDAKINAEINGISNARFICGDAEKALEELRKEGLKPQAVILDPPRKGCSPSVTETVAKIAPQRVVYVSCDPATLARDCGKFAEYGYKALKAAPVDMFPKTGNVETVVQLARQ